MTSPYHSSFSRFLIDLNKDHDHQQFSSAKTEEVSSFSSSSSSSTCPTFMNPLLAERGCHRGELLPLQNQHKGTNADHAKTYTAQGGSHDLHPTLNDSDVSRVKFIVSKKEDRNEMRSEKISDKWKSSKMRLMKKMMISDQTVGDSPKTSADKLVDHKDLASPSQTDNSSNTSPTNSNSTARVCADCNTTKTPLWRSGPRGPKSLCNACGIRQRKAKRAMAAAAAAANGTIFATDTPKVKTKKQHREKKTSNTLLPFKKRCKFTAEARTTKNLCFEDLTLIFNKITALHQRIFPQDEKEAAILLMALSYGLVHG